MFRVLHAIHDFLPRHRAGSEVYAFELAREQSRRHDTFVLAAEFDPSAVHGSLRWRAFDGLPVIEVVNNWRFDRFSETYDSSRIDSQLVHVLDATRPDILHVHNLLNLSFALPRLARERSIPSVATLHDYALVCASGGQRVHVAEAHVCEVIDPDRCSRCFRESPLHGLIVGGAISGTTAGRSLGRAAAAARRRFPAITGAAARLAPGMRVTSRDISDRLTAARQLFDTIEMFVAPSSSMADEYIRLGVDPLRVRVSDYGFRASPSDGRRSPKAPLQIGFVGTLVWHKGVHVLIEALRRLTGAYRVQLFGDPAVHPGYAGQLRRAAAGLPVTFRGPFVREDVARVYSGIDVLVVPSLWPENSPLVIHEAFLYGAAVIAARVGGIPGLIDDGVNGLLYEATSADALAAVLQRCIDDPDLTRRLSPAAPRVKSIEEDAQEWEARYAEVLSRTPNDDASVT